MNWVRLQHTATGTNVLFVNTHGPQRYKGSDPDHLRQNCARTLGNSWAEGVRANRQPGDVLFMTGDYNCRSGTEAMNILTGLFDVDVDGGIDHILTSAQFISGGRREGWPSDHPLIKGLFALPTRPTPAPQLSSSPTAVPGNHYRQVSGVGGWGGLCTCSDGQRYSVGDISDGCASGPASLACEGGSSGECEKVADQSRTGMKVTCAAPAPPALRPSPSPQPSTPTPTPENHYSKVNDVGAWGGWCTCPDGQRYNVGDNDDTCGSLACEGGIAGECERQLDWSRHGMKVTCAAASPSPGSSPTLPSSTPVAECAPSRSGLKSTAASHAAGALPWC
mmetsp:Transcript_74536/g.241972  ORF Transcript_74536/g.241972 Transcript_74536/m.241972 type:complete len:335 (+) Transcript_74536:596-1600(+)